MTHNEMIKEYEEKILGITPEDKKLWNRMKEIEDSYKCPKCEEIRLINVDPTSLVFMCSKCGNLISYEK